MLKFIMKRGSGKTSRLIDSAMATNGLIVVASPGNKKYVEERAKAMGYQDVPHVVDVMSVDRFCGVDNVLDNVFIDEADAVLKVLLSNCNIKAITLSEVG